jgi:hypothetical protein
MAAAPAAERSAVNQAMTQTRVSPPVPARTPENNLGQVPGWLRDAPPAAPVRTDGRTTYWSSPYAGRPYRVAPEAPHVTRAHYLWPIFFGIAGGLLGYFLVKDRDEQLAKRLLITAGVMSVAWIVFWVIIYGVLIAATASYGATIALGG